MSAQMLEVSLLGVGTVLRLGRDAWSMVKRLRQATNEDPPPPAAPRSASRPFVYPSYPPPDAWSVKTRRAPSQLCKDARVYGQMTTVTRDNEFL